MHFIYYETYRIITFTFPNNQTWSSNKWLVIHETIIFIVITIIRITMSMITTERLQFGVTIIIINVSTENSPQVSEDL